MGCVATLMEVAGLLLEAGCMEERNEGVVAEVEEVAEVETAVLAGGA